MYIVLLIHVGGVELHHRCSKRLYIQQAGLKHGSGGSDISHLSFSWCALIRNIFRDDLTMAGCQKVASYTRIRLGKVIEDA